MIEDLQVGADDAGFPVVRWTEIRNDAFGNGGRVRIECRIVKAPNTGQLLFAARGPVRHGTFEETRPWEALRGFSVKRAEELYPTSAQRLFARQLSGKSVLSNMLFGYQEQVLLAEFAGDVRLHLNAVDASQVELERLHLVLTQAFVTRQRELVMRLCEEAYRWPPEDKRVETFEAGRQADLPARWTFRSAIDFGFAVTLLAAFAGLVVWVAWRLFR
ncbi:MAG: hypothetical protein JSS20_11125 [Proteobacteria bacterium]|nr:hypothetical protein [Pseudomonadota bacterium]